MGIIATLREHAAMARGNFGVLFEQLDIPPLPAAVAHLVAELNAPEPDFERLSRVIAAEPELATKVLRTVSSAQYGLRNEVLSIKHALALLGLKRIRSLATAYALPGAVPSPRGSLFRHEAFWADSLLRAFLCRSLTKASHPADAEEAFTASLLADVALPLLL